MIPAPRLLLSLLCLAVTTAFAAKKGAEPTDAPPQLISATGGGAKWATVEQLKQFAALGDPQACFELADRCVEGDGVPRNIPQAVALFEQAAKKGIADGWFRLGKIYHDGLEGAPDYARALENFTTAARLGVAEAQHNIGAMLVSARGVKRDYVEGLAWLLVAKKSGASSDAEAQVRARLARRPMDITAAEARAAEISKNLSNATVQATALGAPTKLPSPPPAATDKPVIVAPKPELPTLPKIPVPLAPVQPVVLPDTPKG